MQDTLPGLVQTSRSLSAQTGSLCRASAAFTTSETCVRATTISWLTASKHRLHVTPTIEPLAMISNTLICKVLNKLAYRLNNRARQ